MGNTDVPHEKWTTFRISLPAVEIQLENNSLMTSVNFFGCKNA